MSPEEKKQFLEKKAKQFEKEAFKVMSAQEQREFDLADGVTKQKILLKALEKRGLAAPSLAGLPNQESEFAKAQRNSITSGEQSLPKGGQRNNMNMSISDQLLQSYTP